MLDVGSSELLMIVIVAVVVIGPKDLPRALYKIGQVVGKARTMSRHFRSGIDAMIREAEMEEMEKKWALENRRIMEQYPAAEALPSLEQGGGAANRSEGDPAPVQEGVTPAGETDIINSSGSSSNVGHPDTLPTAEKEA